MKFHALLPIRDEADIIQQCLEHLLTWADKIYVFDTGSVDETWEIVQDIAHKEKQIIPLRKEPVYYSETKLRGYMFHCARQQMQDGDWFLRVDADEFHHILPPEFVKNHLQTHETIVYHQYYDFRLTQKEVAAWQRGDENITDRQKSIAQRRRYYIPSYYSEPRLCRYRSTMKWPINCSFPINAGFVAQERLPIRHYPHRDPIQLERRCCLRAIMMADDSNRKNWSSPEEHHWSQQDWRQFIVSNDKPELQYWEQGQELPKYQFTNHLRPLPIRLVQRFIHKFLLPILDRQRVSFPDDAQPQAIPEAINKILTQELKIE
ncbi:MAG: glycosyltransferase family 2 protein [Cyanobacteria bacterium P01_F01_bin.143]